MYNNSWVWHNKNICKPVVLKLHQHSPHMSLGMRPTHEPWNETPHEPGNEAHTWASEWGLHMSLGMRPPHEPGNEGYTWEPRNEAHTWEPGNEAHTRAWEWGLHMRAWEWGPHKSLGMRPTHESLGTRLPAISHVLLVRLSSVWRDVRFECLSFEFKCLFWPKKPVSWLGVQPY